MREGRVLHLRCGLQHGNEQPDEGRDSHDRQRNRYREKQRFLSQGSKR